jgi:hypothetical protein
MERELGENCVKIVVKVSAKLKPIASDWFLCLKIFLLNNKWYVETTTLQNYYSSQFIRYCETMNNESDNGVVKQVKKHNEKKLKKTQNKLQKITHVSEYSVFI